MKKIPLKTLFRTLLRRLLPLGLIALACTARATGPTLPAETPVVEFAAFRLKPGATEAELRTASPSVDKFLATCPGFVSRLLVADKDGLYTDIVVWRSQRDADAALKAHELHPDACADFMCLLKEDEVTMKHLPVLHATPAPR
ncbi:MAG: hypothetical protein HYV95_04210 [Opitutae bacterium]|nr:hypothetical protein [Opitutae bacterium]